MKPQFFSHLTPVGKVPEILVDHKDHLGVFHTIGLVRLGQGSMGQEWDPGFSIADPCG